MAKSRYSNTWCLKIKQVHKLVATPCNNLRDQEVEHEISPPNHLNPRVTLLVEKDLNNVIYDAFNRVLQIYSYNSYKRGLCKLIKVSWLIPHVP